jgi:hypothetical protein
MSDVLMGNFVSFNEVDDLWDAMNFGNRSCFPEIILEIQSYLLAFFSDPTIY